MRTALDTNILAYAEGIGDLKRQKASIGLKRLHEQLYCRHVYEIPVLKKAIEYFC